jgi:hypothetical protein
VEDRVKSFMYINMIYYCQASSDVERNSQDGRIRVF